MEQHPFEYAAAKGHLSFDDMELSVLDTMCTLFRAGRSKDIDARSLVADFGVDEKRSFSLFQRLITTGALEKYHVPALHFTGQSDPSSYRISGRVCEVAAQRRAELESMPDQVSALEKKARSHPWIAVVIILAVLYVFLVTAANQTLELFDKWDGDAPPAAPADEAKQGSVVKEQPSLNRK